MRSYDYYMTKDKRERDRERELVLDGGGRSIDSLFWQRRARALLLRSRLLCSFSLLFHPANERRTY